MSSTMSLDSLSSPSPSPSPGLETSHMGPEPARAGLDSDSELSELTEEEQEGENTNHNHDRDEDEDHEKPRRTARRDAAVISRSDWGKRRKISDKSANVVEEEEEEELSGPPKAMEEEEEEEEEDEDDDEDDGPSRPDSRVNENDFDEDDEEEEVSRGDEDIEGDPPADVVDEEESVSGDVDRVVRNRRGARGQRASTYHNREDGYTLSSRKKKTYDSDDDDDDLSELPTGQQNDAAETDNDETNSEDGGGDDDPGQKPKSPSVPIAVTSRALKTNPSTTHTDIGVDLTAPLPQSVGLSLAAAAASSIMAGSTVLVPPSPSASSTSSAMSSRSPTPTIEPSGKGSKALEVEGGASSRRNSMRKLSISDKHAEVPPVTNDKNNNAVTAEAEAADQDGSVGDIEVDEPSPDQDVEMELESDLQPAHRAEALDVLATIELKFALLRERVYVEKMECLAWEEALVGEGTHPELIHLLAELSKRRDKRLELASRKRAYEIANVTKKRVLEENATWSWWKVARDDLQTDMISETNRKRRRLERERRATERPQPVRRIPKPPQDVPIPPTLRQVAKSFPLAMGKQQSVQKKRDHASSANAVYPQLSELSSADIAADRNYLLQHRRPSGDAQRIGNINANGVNTHIGHPLPHVYDQYNGVEGTNMSPFGGIGPASRMLPPPTPSFPNQHQHIPLATGQPPVTGYPSFGPGTARHDHYSSSTINLHSHHHQPQYPAEHDLAPVVSTPGTLAHYSQHHPYFGAAPGPLGHGHSNVVGHHGQRRSISPVPIMPNGLNGPQGRSNSGGWGHKPSGSNEWMGNGRRHDVPINDGEDDDRDGMRMREMRREKERMRDRGERDREREQHEYEREHDRERTHHIQQQQHRHTLPGPQPPHQQVHGPPGPVSHHVVGPHHHHHHHHHVVHNHSPSGSGGGHVSSAPPLPGHGPTLSPRIITSRDFEIGRSQSGPSRPTEIINLSSKPTISSTWKGDDFPPPPLDQRKHVGRPSSGPPILDERERTLAMPFVMNSHGMPREAAVSAPPNGTATVSPPRGSWNNADDSVYRLPPQTSSAPSSFLGSADGHGHSPKHRYTNPTGTGQIGRGQPPPPVLQNSIGHSPPRARPFPPSPSSSTYAAGPSRSPNRYGQSMHGPGASPPHSHVSSVLASPNLKTRRATSPVLGGKLARSPGSGFSPRTTGPVRTTTPTSLAPPLDPKNSGSVGSTAVSYGIGSRTASPHLPFLSPVLHQPPPPPPPPRPVVVNSNGVGHSERLSPHLPSMPPPQKMSVAQMVEGR